ncbi:MAG: hypothetical protein FJX47_02825 [Alphaproteobacteria bacterium]|nr:hypothetical protein [Alphaproteobacteria bacterium]
MAPYWLAEFGLDAEGGQAAWRYQTGNLIMASPTLLGDAAWVASTDKFLHAINLATGRAARAPIALGCIQGAARPQVEPGREVCGGLGAHVACWQG